MSQLFPSGGQSIGSFSFSISPSNEYSGLIFFRMDWLNLLSVQGTCKSLLQHPSSKASILRCSAFFIVQLSHLYTTTQKIMALHMDYICVRAKLLQLCPALCGPMHCSPPGSSVLGILQERVLEWAAVPSSRGSSRPRAQTCISGLQRWQGGSFPLVPPGKPRAIYTYTHKGCCH